MEDPDFTPGSMRAVLEEGDAIVAQLTSNIALNARNWEDALLMRGQILGAQRILGVIRKNTDDETKRRLGIRQ